MIKSYKFILIIEAVILLLFWFFKPYISFDENRSFGTFQIFILSFLPAIVLGISILFQKVAISVIQSDSGKIHEGFSEEKIWKISFYTNLIFAIVAIIAVMIIWLLKFEIAPVTTYDFSRDMATILLTLLIASFAIGILLVIKKTVWEVNKFVGILVTFISILVFLAAVYIPAIGYFYLNKTFGDSVENTVEVSDSADEMTEVADEPDTKDHDFYSFNQKDFSDVETGGYFEKYYDRGTNENAKSQELLALFLSKNLDLRDDQYVSEVRRAIMYAQHEDEFSEINDIDEQMGRKPEEIRQAFDSYKPLIYAFLNDKIYFDSNLNLIVEALIASHEDIAETENAEVSMKKINTIMNMGFKGEFPGEYFESLQPFMSEKVLAPLKKNAQKFEEEFEYNYKLNAVWIYSFWGRRFEEKNHEEVFKILQEINGHYQES